MGCKVTQTESSTTVTGPESLKPLCEIDMESMTDAFMTATVLAAVADLDVSKITRITGIANQRVKECNRIEAMVTELKKLGVTASELPDGLQINAIDRRDLKSPVEGIYCYDDHRIAMSFSVLACATEFGPIITQKNCVDKTWPGWWDQFSQNLGCQLTGMDILPLESPIHSFQRDLNSSIILIGMRGSGKSHMGKAAARILNRVFIDMDEYFEQKEGVSIPLFVNNSGWESFRLKEVEYLKFVLNENPTDAVIACGGGIVELEMGRRTLKLWRGPVVHIQRDLEAIASYLNVDTTRPSYKDSVFETWSKREPWYRECASLEYFVISPSLSSGLNHYNIVEKNFGVFLEFVTSPNKFTAPTLESTSFFVCLTCSDVQDIAMQLEDITIGVDAVELRVDLLHSVDPGFVAKQIALIRHYSRKPIVFTVRTSSQGGRFPDHMQFDMIELLKLGLKCGCEYIDIEFTQPYGRFDDILKFKGNSLIIGSYHDTAGLDSWSSTGTMISKYKDLHKRSDVIKLIGRAKILNDNFELYTFVHDFVSGLGLESKPIIALLMGPLGQLSRHLSNFLTPVTHPLLTTAAAPGQVSVVEIHQTRHNIGLLPTKNYCLFGSPITQSMSPMLHNTGFEMLGFPYNYSLSETCDIATVKERMINFDGASVTIPLKVDIISSGICNEIDVEAQKIGAVNTLTKSVSGIRGSNTDWLGIKACIEKSIHNDKPIIGGSKF